MSKFVEKSSRGLLLAAINRGLKEGYSYTFQDISFAAPVNGDFQGGKTTEVVYSALPETAFEGVASAFFDKLDLEAFFTNSGVDAVQVRASDVTGTSTSNVVTALNARYGTAYDAEDIVVEDFVADSGAVILKAAEGSFVWAGELAVEIVEAVPGKTPLADVVLNPVLSDLYVPAPVPGYVIDVVLGNGAVTPKAQKEDGTLLAGNGNPAGGLQTAENGEIELAIGARVYRSGDLTDAVDGKYSIVIPADGDWNFPFSAALLQSEAVISDLYDVTLTIASVATQESVAFELSRDEEGVFHFINSELALDINDSASTASGSVVQNIQRVKFYAEHLGAVETNTGGAPIGDYTLSLKAARREGLTAPVETVITVSVSTAVA